MEDKINQCDGCRRGLEIKDGIHCVKDPRYLRGYRFDIACTKERYTAPKVFTDATSQRMENIRQEALSSPEIPDNSQTEKDFLEQIECECHCHKTSPGSDCVCTIFTCKHCSQEEKQVGAQDIAQVEKNHTGDTNEMVAPTWQEKEREAWEKTIQNSPSLDSVRTYRNYQEIADYFISRMEALVEQAKAEAYAEFSERIEKQIRDAVKNGGQEERARLFGIAEKLRITRIYPVTRKTSRKSSKQLRAEAVYQALSDFISQAQAGEDTK